MATVKCMPNVKISSVMTDNVALAFYTAALSTEELHAYLCNCNY